MKQRQIQSIVLLGESLVFGPKSGHFRLPNLLQRLILSPSNDLGAFVIHQRGNADQMLLTPEAARQHRRLQVHQPKERVLMSTFRYSGGDRPLDGFTIEYGLGRGGFGEVYFAKSDAGREVALKVIQNYEDIELRGVSHCMNLKSPHLVTIFDVKNDATGRPWVVMEYVAGPCLKDLLDEADAQFVNGETSAESNVAGEEKRHRRRPIFVFHA